MPELIVKVVGDTSQLERSFKRAETQTRGFAKDMERVGRGATVATIGFRGLGRSVAFASGAFLGGAGLTAAVKSSVEAASNLNEQLSAARVVFGQSADEIDAWSKTAAQGMGLARDQAVQAAASFGGLAKAAGLTGKAAVTTVEDLIQRGADLASLYNTSVQDALDAIRSGIVGEAEPLRRFNVLISEASTTQQALAETGKASATQLTEQEKAHARLALIMGRSTIAAGNFADTSKGLANQTRILQGQIRNLQIELGKHLIPAAAAFISFINEVWIPGLHDAGVLVDNLAGKVGNLAERIKHSSPLFEITGLQLGKALVRGFQIGLGIEGKGGGGAGRGLGDALTTLVKGAIGEIERSISQGVAELNRPGTSIAATSLGTDVTQKQRRLNVPAGQRNTIFDARITRALDRVQDIPTLRGQITRLREIRKLIEDRIKVTQDVTRKLNLGDQIAQINRSILADQTQIAENAKAAANKLKAKEEAARKAEKAAQAASLKRAEERVAAINKAARAQVARLAKLGTQLRNAQRAREQRQQFLALGLTATGQERTPTRGNLQAQLRKVEAQIAGGPLDTKAMESRLAKVRKVLNDGFGKLTVDTRRAVAEFLDALAGKDQAGGPATKQQAASLHQLVAGTGLAGAGLRRLEFNLAGAHLTVPPRGGGRTTVVHTSVNLDGRQVARNTTEHQERQQRRVAYQTRGRQRNK